jgi:hypothetical protein
VILDHTSSAIWLKGDLQILDESVAEGKNMNFPNISRNNSTGQLDASKRVQESPKKAAEIPPKPAVEASDAFVSSDDEKASNWSTFHPVKKIGVTAIAGWWGAILGGAAIVAATSAAPVVALGLGVAAGVGIAQGATRLTKSDQTKAQVKEAKAKRAEEPSSWKTSSLGDKAKALGMSAWLGASIVGIGLAVLGGVAPVLALAVGAGTGMAAATGAMAISKDSDGSGASYSSSSDDSSSLLGMTADGKLGFHMGGGMVVGTDGKVGFGFEL